MNKNVFSYCSAMAQARRLMCDGIITAKDYEEIDTILLQKYNLQLSSLSAPLRCKIYPCSTSTMPSSPAGA